MTSSNLVDGQPIPRRAPCGGMCYDFHVAEKEDDLGRSTPTVLGISASSERQRSCANAKHPEPHGEQRGIRLKRVGFPSLLALLAILTLGGLIHLFERRIIENTEHN
jgi:hypothetical protein